MISTVPKPMSFRLNRSTPGGMPESPEGNDAINNHSHQPSRQYLALIVLGFFLTFLCAQERPFRHYTPTAELNPLPSASVDQVFQDRYGYLWICVYSSGLVRFDGQEMELFDKHNGLRNPNVLHVLEDISGRLWVLSDGGLYASTKPQSEYSQHREITFTDSLTLPLVTASINQTTVNNLAADSSHLWVGTNRMGLVRYTFADAVISQADTFGIASTEETMLPVLSLELDPDGALWFAVPGGLAIIQADSDSARIVANTENDVHAMLWSEEAGLLFGDTEGKLFQFDERQSKAELLYDDLNEAVYDIYRDSSGQYWICSNGDGLVRRYLDQPQVTSRLSTTNGLISNSLQNVIEDREGNFWISQSGGLSMLRGNFEAFTHISQNTIIQNKPVLKSTTITTIEVPLSAAGNFPMYLSTHGGVVAWPKDGPVDIIDSQDGLSSEIAYDIARDSHDRLWIGTFEGLDCIFPAGKQPKTGSSKFSKLNIHNESYGIAFFDIGITGVCSRFELLKENASGETAESIWFNSYNRISCYLDEDLYIFDAASGIPGSIIYSVTYAPSGHLWVGTGGNGVLRSTKPFTSEYIKGLRRNGSYEVQSVEFEPVWNATLHSGDDYVLEIKAVDDQIWIGCDAGIYCIDAETMQLIKHFTQSDGMKDDHVASMNYNEATHTIWAGTNTGLAQVDVGDLAVLKHITRDDGLLSNEAFWLESVVVGNSNTVFYGSPDGLTIYQPELDTLKSPDPQPIVKNYQLEQSARGNNVFLAEYVAPSYQNPKQIRYRSRLTGYDDDWSEPTANLQIRYTSLPAYLWSTAYTFEVQAGSGDTKWQSAPAQLQFEIEPALWFQWWAFLLYIAIITVAAQGSRWLAKNWRIVLAPRKRYLSHYRIFELLGKGGMGQVFRARDVNTSNIVAIKLLNEELLEDEQARERFASEGRLLASLESPHIVKVLEAGEHDGQGFIAMEYLSGPTLAHYIAENFPLSEEETVAFLRQISLGLKNIHDRGIVHRDLKSGNIMMDEYNQLRIMDFGISKSHLVATMTSLGTVLGTLGYVAPEQVTGSTVDHRADIFSLGVVCYELLTGKLAFTGENEMALIHAIFNATPPAPSAVAPGVQITWDVFVERCLEKSPDARFQSVDEILGFLEQLSDN